MLMDIRKIKQLVELLNNSRFAEIEIKEGDDSIRIISHYPQNFGTTETSQQIWNTVANNPVTSGAVNIPVLPVPAAKLATELETVKGYLLRSPMVGTFYRSASPSSRPFVKIGQKIDIGDTVGIIEAMKMFNEIESDRLGIVTCILVENGQPIEYDQPLMVIE